MTLHDAPPSPECGVRLHDLRRHRFGELDRAQSERIAAHAEGCDTCQARLQTMAHEADQFAASADVAVQSAQILERLEAQEGTPAQASLWSGGFALIAAVAAALLVALPVMLHEPEPENRIKGSVALELYVNGPTGIERASSGVKLSPGDQIQFRYRSDGHRFLMVVSVDGRLIVSTLHPSEPGDSLHIEPQGSHSLAGSVILDDAIGPERVFAIYSTTPLTFDRVKSVLETEIVRTGGDVTQLKLDALGDDVEDASLLIVKVPR